jgi:hypothetical protein
VRNRSAQIRGRVAISAVWIFGFKENGFPEIMKKLPKITSQVI